MAITTPPALPTGGKWVNPDGTPTLAFLEYQSKLNAWAGTVKSTINTNIALAAATGTFDNTTFVTDTVTLQNLARRVGVIISILRAAGLAV